MNKTRLLNALIIAVIALIILLVVVFVRAARSTGDQGATAIPEPTATPKPAADEGSDDAAIQNILWQWTQLTDQSSGEVTSVPNPAGYTIVFYPDETIYGIADCNSFSGTYSTRSGFSISVKSSTRAYCGEESLDTLYLRTLQDIAAGGPDGAGGLALETAGGRQRMQFQNGGAAP